MTKNAGTFSPALSNLRCPCVNPKSLLEKKGCLNQNGAGMLPAVMKVSLVWHTPNPERTIAVAMRRCYSTKPIEEIEVELEQKGREYWKYLLTRAIQDKSLDVFEHYCLELLIEDTPEDEMRTVASAYPFTRLLPLNGRDWLFAMNARTLIEMWRDEVHKPFASTIIEQLNLNNTSPVFNAVAFGA